MLRKLQIATASIIGGFVAIDAAIPRVKRYLSNNIIDDNQDIQRVKVHPLYNLKKKFEEIGFFYDWVGGSKFQGNFFSCSDDYWIEGFGYKDLIKSTHEIHNMCLEATDLAINDDEILTKIFDIPQDMIPTIRQSWNQRHTDLLTRYDFLIGNNGQIHFLECNGDTPSGIIESGSIQRVWADGLNMLQFNILEKNIQTGFKDIMKKYQKDTLVMFKNEEYEDTCTFNCLYKIFNKENLFKIQENEIFDFERILDISNTEKNYREKLFWKQYPFEWLSSEQSKYILNDPRFFNFDSQTLLEPPWKIVMSNKAMSVLLKVMYPDSPYFVESSLAPYPQDENQISKQKYSREGSDAFVSKNKNNYQDFLKNSYLKYVHMPIFQKFIESQTHQNRYITIGSWVVSGKPSGFFFREDLNKITGKGSSVVPYFIEKSEDREKQIEIQLENSIDQACLRQTLYGEQEEFESNDIMIKIKQRVNSIQNFQIDKQKVKSELMQQREQGLQERNTIHEIKNEDLSQEFQKAKNNKLLIGFSFDDSNLKLPQTKSNDHYRDDGMDTLIVSTLMDLHQDNINRANNGNYSIKRPANTRPKVGSTGIKYSSFS